MEPRKTIRWLQDVQGLRPVVLAKILTASLFFLMAKFKIEAKPNPDLKQMESCCYCLPEQGNPPVATLASPIRQCSAAPCARAGSPHSLWILLNFSSMLKKKKSAVALASERVSVCD